MPAPASLGLVQPLPERPHSPASGAPPWRALPRAPSGSSLPAFDFPALPSKEQIEIDLAFTPPPVLVDDGDGPRRVPQRIAPPPPEDTPVTLKQLQESQNALLLDLRVTAMNRPVPEIDVHALRKKLAREDYLDALCGRTIHSRS